MEIEYQSKKKLSLKIGNHRPRLTLYTFFDIHLKKIVNNTVFGSVK